MNSIRKWVVENEKLLRYVLAGIALFSFLRSLTNVPHYAEFVGYSVENLLDCIRFGYGFGNAIGSVFYFAHSLALLLSVPVELAFAVGLYFKKDSLVKLYIIFNLIERILQLYVGSFLLVILIMWVLFYLLLLLACLKKNEKSAYLGFAACALFLLIMILSRYNGIGFGTPLLLITSVGLGLIYSAHPSKVKPATAAVANRRTDGQNDIEKITKLGELFANGIITKEEFETKKKQILGI